MLIPSSSFGSGNIRIGFNRQSSTSIEVNQEKILEENQEAKSNTNKFLDSPLSNSNSQTSSYKLANSYLKHQALNQYIAMENFEKIEFAKSALGFNVYA